MNPFDSHEGRIGTQPRSPQVTGVVDPGVHRGDNRLGGTRGLQEDSRRPRRCGMKSKRALWLTR
jgi:hypothetical protein